jgi:hypothetical protein
MSLSKLSPIFQFSWQPSKYVIIGVLFIYCIALGCLYWSNLPMLIKAILVVIVSLYTIVEVRKYTLQLKTLFFSDHLNVQCQQGLCNIMQLHNLQWQDWGFVIVLNARLNAKKIQWLWLMHQLSISEIRQLRLLIRAEQKKVATYLPPITTNPVL